MAPIHTLETLVAAYQNGYNLGIRPGEYSHTPFGYLHLIDMDIRKPEQAAAAWACLLERWPEARSAPYVISGSGGESRHIYLFTDKPFRSVSFGKSTGSEMIFDPKKGRDVQKWDWEVGLYGTRAQAVLPPSIHPDTGQRYRWGREIDWDLLDIGVGPIVPSSVVETWGAQQDDLNIDDDDDLMGLVKARPMGLSEAEITRILNDIPNDDAHHDDYVEVGMALHHEYQGSQVGFERWCEWAKASRKFDLRTCVTKWRSFKGRKNPVRMATLIKKAGQLRLERAHADLEADDDLLGVPTPDLDDDFLALPGTALAVIPDKQSLADEFDDLLDLPPRPKPASVAPGARVAPVYDPEWRSYLQLNEEGQIKPTLHNVELIIWNDKRMRGLIGLNEFTQNIMQVGKPGRFKLKKGSPKPVRQLDGPLWELRDPVNGDLWSDSHDIALRLLLETPDRQGGYSLQTTDRNLFGAVNRAAQMNRYHPVRDFLSGLQWDGVNRVERLFIDYVGAADNAYHREAALLFMVGAVARVFEPGHKFDFVPILEGLQGVRKSTFIKILAHGWFAELDGDFHDKKALVESMQGAWIVELPELQGFSKAEITTIKGFVSRPVDKVRLSYEKRAAEFPRQCVFMGSTNETEYLRDATGGRRFWPIACSVTEIDTDRLEREIGQLWAEAKAMYDAWRSQQPHGTLPLYIRDPDASAEARRLQESRRQESASDALAGQIEAWLDRPINADLGFDDLPDEVPVYRDQVCLLEVWVEMMGNDRAKYDDRAQQMLGRAMRQVSGWRYSHRDVTPKYGRQRIFVRREPL